MNEKKEKYTAVVLAAGKGTRMGGSVAKQFLEIGGKPVVVYALEVFEHSPEIDHDTAVDAVVVVLGELARSGRTASNLQTTCSARHTVRTWRTM